MNRKAAPQINKCSRNTPPSSSGDKTCKKLVTVPVADKLQGILKSLQTDNDKSLPDRGDISKKAKPSPKSILADVAKIVFEDSKVQTVNRCSSIGNVTDDCVTKTATKKRQVKRVPPKPACNNSLCRDRCRITFEERQRLRQRYTFRLKQQHTPKEDEEKVAVEEEDSKKIATRLKYFYLPNDKSLDASFVPKPVNTSAPRAKAVTFTADRPLMTTYAMQRLRKPVTKLSKSTSPVKLHAMLSKSSIKAKRHKAKKKGYCVRRSSSPELANCLSPPTEITRWIPDAASVHAKPYYDAWVSTTLAAISHSQRPQNDDLYRQKKEIVQRLTRNYEEAVRNTHCLLTNSRCRVNEAHEDWDYLVDLPKVDETVVGRIRVKR